MPAPCETSPPPAAKAYPKHKGVPRRSGHLAFPGHRSVVAFRNIMIAEIKS